MLSFWGEYIVKLLAAYENQRPRNWPKNFIKASGLIYDCQGGHSVSDPDSFVSEDPDWESNPGKPNGYQKRGEEIISCLM
jgi:hypothetical protein